MRRPLRLLLKLLLIPPILAAIVGWIVAPWFLHPFRRALTTDMIRNADIAFARVHARREDFNVNARDGVLLRGWKVSAAQPDGDWVLLFHGVGDNRVGVLEHSLVLLSAGYNVVMMDARSHGESDGAMATYGWIERHDTQSIVNALDASERPRHLFALGESMGAGIAFCSRQPSSHASRR
jgi:predicted alpha/beta-fold hydrolase